MKKKIFAGLAVVLCALLAIITVDLNSSNAQENTEEMSIDKPYYEPSEDIDDYKNFKNLLDYYSIEEVIAMDGEEWSLILNQEPGQRVEINYPGYS